MHCRFLQQTSFGFHRIGNPERFARAPRLIASSPLHASILSLHANKLRGVIEFSRGVTEFSPGVSELLRGVTAPTTQTTNNQQPNDHQSCFAATINQWQNNLFGGSPLLIKEHSY